MFWYRFRYHHSGQRKYGITIPSLFWIVARHTSIQLMVRGINSFRSRSLHWSYRFGLSTVIQQNITGGIVGLHKRAFYIRIYELCTLLPKLTSLACKKKLNFTVYTFNEQNNILEQCSVIYFFFKNINISLIFEFITD